MNNTNFLTVPYNILNLEGLTLSAKVLLAEIISLSKLEGFCYASNSYLANRIGISTTTTSTALCELRKKGYISSKRISQSKREIRVSACTKSVLAEHENRPSGYTKSVHNNNRYNNIYNINYKENKSHSRKSEASYDIEELMKIR